MQYKVETTITYSTEVDEGDFEFEGEDAEASVEEKCKLIQEVEQDNFDGSIPDDAKIVTTVTPVTE